MIRDFSEFLDGLKEKGMLSRIALLYLFGSAAVQKSTPVSDIDIAVLFDESLADSAEREGILQDMIEIGARSLDVPEELIDVKALEDSPLCFQIQVISKGSLVYVRNMIEKELYESQVLSEHLDFLYCEDIHHNALQKRMTEGNFGHRPKIIISSSS